MRSGSGCAARSGPYRAAAATLGGLWQQLFAALGLVGRAAGGGDG